MPSRKLVTVGADRSGDSDATVASTILRYLSSAGVDHVFLNPGTDTAPFQEAAKWLASHGLEAPSMVLCPHESLALSAAHGYFLRTGRPQVVMVHVDVGTQNLGAMLHNVQRGEAGVIIVAGRSPETFDGLTPGGRDTPVHWQQDTTDQPGIVRSYVKWTGDLSGRQFHHQIARAVQVASSEPFGAAYITATREVLLESYDQTDADLPRVRRPTKATLPYPDPEATREAARLLLGASAPVVVTARIGRNPDAVSAMARLASLVGAAVIDQAERVNIPWDHPGVVADPDAQEEALRSADVILVLDCLVPWLPCAVTPPSTCVVIQVERDPLHLDVPSWSFPVDLAITCEPFTGLLSMLEAVEGLLADGRPADPSATRPGASAGRDGDATPSAGGNPIAARTVGRALSLTLGDRDIVVEEATTDSGDLRSTLTRRLAGTYFRSGGSGLGWALGASAGIAMAAPGVRTVAVVGDGAFFFANPLAWLWMVKSLGLPILAVVMRNGGYAASRKPVFRLFPGGVSAVTKDIPGTLFSDHVDIARVVLSCDIHAENVKSADRLVPAFDEALRVVDAGRPAVLSVEVTSPWM